MPAFRDHALTDGWNIPAQTGWPAGLDQGRRAEVDIAADVRKYANRRHQQRANEPDDNDFQVGGAIGAVHRVIHATLSLAARGRIDLS